jgi:hypothetical protein
MFEPGATVDADGSTGSDGQLPTAIQSGEAAQSAGLFEPNTIRGATLSILGFGRASPSLRQGWTKPERKTNMNPVLGLTQKVVQKVEPGHLSTLKTTEVLGGKTTREIAEQLRINKLGGIQNLENIRNPIGPARQYLLPGNSPL